MLCRVHWKPGFQSCIAALVAADEVEKTLHLNIAFGRVSSSQFWDAIEGQLSPPMAQLGAEEDLKTFASTFDGVKFRKGDRQSSAPVDF